MKYYKEILCTDDPTGIHETDGEEVRSFDELEADPSFQYIPQSDCFIGRARKSDRFTAEWISYDFDHEGE